MDDLAVNAEKQRRAVMSEYEEAVSGRHWLLAGRIRSANPDLFPRVLVEVRGGIAYVSADPGVHCEIVDYDNEPSATVSRHFADLKL